MDEFARRTEEDLREARRDVRKVEMGLRSEMDERFARVEAKLDRKFNILFGALATGLVAVAVQHFVA